MLHSTRRAAFWGPRAKLRLNRNANAIAPLRLQLPPRPLLIRSYSAQEPCDPPLMFALIRPHDPNTGLLRALNPFAGVRTAGGPDLYALVCVPARTHRGLRAEPSKLGQASTAASENQTHLSGWLATSSGRRARARAGRRTLAARGGSGGGSQLGPSRGPLRQPYAVDGRHRGREPGLFQPLHQQCGQLEGRLRNNAGASQAGAPLAEQAARSARRQLAQLRPGPPHLWSNAVHLTREANHPATHSDGYVAAVVAERIIAHAAFRNVFIKTSLEDLRWELCLLWPEPTPLRAVEYRDGETGWKMNGAELHRTTLRAVMDGRVRVRVHGHPLSFCDPNHELLPKAVSKRAVAVGLASFAGMMAGLLGPGMVAMVASAVYPKVWRHLPEKFGRPPLPPPAYMVEFE